MRRKRVSPTLVRAQTRAAAIDAIDPAVDLGNGMTQAGYKQQIGEIETQLATYNTHLSTLDALQTDLLASEKKLREISGRMLSGIASKFGKDSNEYEKAGGTRTSLRKSPRHAAKTEAVAK